MPRGKRNGAPNPGRQTAPEAEDDSTSAPNAEQVAQSGNIGSNSKERAAIIAEAVSNIIRLKGEKNAIQEQITEQRARVKALGIKAIDFTVALRLHELEVEDRNSSLDSIRECCEALGMGETVDWVKVVETADGKTSGAPGFTAEVGRQAWRDNKRLHDNPYPTNSASGELWKTGYLEEQAAHARAMGPQNGEVAATH